MICLQLPSWLSFKTLFDITLLFLAIMSMIILLISVLMLAPNFSVMNWMTIVLLIQLQSEPLVSITKNKMALWNVPGSLFE